MATSTQHNPNPDLNGILFEAGASKTVYALVTPEVEIAKAFVFGDDKSVFRAAYLDQFREAWTGKQDAYHQEFFDRWCEWARAVVNLDRNVFPFSYPTAGASEALRHLIYDYAIRATTDFPIVHVFKGEYEGYKAMAEAANLRVIEHDREDWEIVAETLDRNEMFFLSQPSAIDGNVWQHADNFLRIISNTDEKWDIPPRVVLDLTYVGATRRDAFKHPFNVNHRCVRNVVFSLSKPFGAYYDRIGGVFSREEDLGLFGNKWFKNLTSLSIGNQLMIGYDVFEMATRYDGLQKLAAMAVGSKLGIELTPSDVFIIATAPDQTGPMADYLRRYDKLRLCLTLTMASVFSKESK